MPDAGLVLHRSDRVAVHLDHIGAPGQSQRLRPERNATQDSEAAFHAVLSTIHAPVRPRAHDGVSVVGPDAIAVDQGALTRTVDEVLNRGDRYDGLGRHRICAPMALVLSADPRG